MISYPARVIFRGRFGREDIVVEQIELPPLPPEVDSCVENVWAAERKRNPNLEPRPLLVAAALEEHHGRLTLRCGRSDYKRFMGTTADEGVPEEYRHRAIGVLAITTTVDGYVLLGVRSPAIDWGLLRHVVPAGRLQPDERDPYTGITAEFVEELGLVPADLLSLECIGVVADETWGRLNFEFVFRAVTHCSARQVLERAKTAQSAREHCQLEPFVWRSDFVRDLLLVDPEGYVPTGWAGLAIAIQRDFGMEEFPQWLPAHRPYAEHVERHLQMICRADTV